MLNPKIIRHTIHQVNMDRNLSLTNVEINILTDAVNNTFRYADTPAENIAKIQEQIDENRTAGHRLINQRDKMKSDCQHVWLRQMYENSPYFCQACKEEVSL